MTYKHTKYGCYMSYFTSAVINNLAPLLFFTFSRKFSLSVMQLGFIVTLNFLTQAIVDFLGARYASSFGYRKAIIAAHIFAFFGLVMLGTLPYIMKPYAGILISVVLYATGSGIIEVMVSPMVEALPGDGKNASMSFLHSFYCWGQMGVVLISTLYFQLFSTANWRYLPYVWAILPVMSIAIFSKAPICSSDADVDAHSGFFRLLKSKALFPFFIIMLCAGASELALSQWASYFAESGLKVSKALGDLLGPCFFAVMMGVSRVLYGIYAEKLPLKKSIAICSALCCIAYLMASLSPWPMVSLLGCGLCGFSVGIMWPGTLSMAAHSVNDSTAVFGILALTGDIGCTAGPTLISLVSSRISLFGDPVKAGVLCSVIFPFLIILTMLLCGKSIKDK